MNRTSVRARLAQIFETLESLVLLAYSGLRFATPRGSAPPPTRNPLITYSDFVELVDPDRTTSARGDGRAAES
jgi:hypothetical protein